MQALGKTNGYLPKLSTVKASVDVLLKKINPATQVHSHRTLNGLSEDIVKVTADLQERRHALEAETLEGTDTNLKELLKEAENLVTSGNQALRKLAKLHPRGRGPHAHGHEPPNPQPGCPWAAPP